MAHPSVRLARAAVKSHNIQHKNDSGENPLRDWCFRSQERVEHIRRSPLLGFVNGAPVNIDTKKGLCQTALFLVEKLGAPPSKARLLAFNRDVVNAMFEQTSDRKNTSSIVREFDRNIPPSNADTLFTTCAVMWRSAALNDLVGTTRRRSTKYREGAACRTGSHENATTTAHVSHKCAAIGPRSDHSDAGDDRHWKVHLSGLRTFQVLRLQHPRGVRARARWVIRTFLHHSTLHHARCVPLEIEHSAFHGTENGWSFFQVLPLPDCWHTPLPRVW